GDLDLRQVIAIFAVAELDEPPFVENLGVAVGGAGIDAKKARIEVVNADGVLVEVGLGVMPGTRHREPVEHVGKAIVLEVKGANGLAQAGLQGVEVGCNPGLNLVEAMVTLRSD